MDIQPEFALAGFVVGILVGLTGLGGGSIMAPMLILVFKIEPAVAVGTDLFYMAVTKLFGAGQHHRQGNVDYRLAALLAAGSIPGALCGILVLYLLSNNLGFPTDTFITRLLAVVLVLVGLSLLFFGRFRSSSFLAPANRPILIPVLGAVIGFLVAVTSVGSGSLFLILIIALYGLPLRRIIGTDVFHGFALVAVAAGGHALVGHVDFPLAANLLIGSVPGVLIGSKLTVLMSERKLGTAVGIVLFGVGVRLMI